MQLGWLRTWLPLPLAAAALTESECQCGSATGQLSGPPAPGDSDPSESESGAMILLPNAKCTHPHGHPGCGQCEPPGGGLATFGGEGAHESEISGEGRSIWLTNTGTGVSHFRIVPSSKALAAATAGSSLSSLNRRSSWCAAPGISRCSTVALRSRARPPTRHGSFSQSDRARTGERTPRRSALATRPAMRAAAYHAFNHACKALIMRIYIPLRLSAPGGLPGSSKSAACRATLGTQRRRSPGTAPARPLATPSTARARLPLPRATPCLVELPLGSARRR